MVARRPIRLHLEIIVAGLITSTISSEQKSSTCPRIVQLVIYFTFQVQKRPKDSNADV